MSGPVLAQVIVDIAGHQLGDRLFSYTVPPHLAGLVKVGSMVTVPFGRISSRRACVVTVDVENSANVAPEKLKEILDVVDSRQLFDKKYFAFLQAVADYYMAPMSGVIAASLPPKVDMKTRQIKTIVWKGDSPRTDKQKNIVEALKHAGGQMPLPELLEAVGTTRGTVMRMEKEGIVAVVERELVRDPLAQYGLAAAQIPAVAASGNPASVASPPAGSPVLPELTPDQQKVYSVLDNALQKVLGVRKQSGNGDSAQSNDDMWGGSSNVQGNDNVHCDDDGTQDGGSAQPWLIHGVTGSGKTEIYLRLIARTLAAGRSALLMVPEISLTPQLADRLQERFEGLVSVWHSGLSAGERYDTWCRLGSGQIRVLLGARSAVFADMPELGLIVLDEEHDASYKQSSPQPRYNAKHVAVEKAVRCGAMVVLGSATPDVISLHAARTHSRLLVLPKRVAEQPMPQVEIVDMRMEFQQGHQGDFSRRLQEEISACLSRKEQIILLMNRRGFAQHVFCKACGFVMKCRHCSVSLVLHQYANIRFLACHHCGYRTSFVSTCPGCNEWQLEAYGLGTQKVEHELSRLFPSARVLRLDGDVVAKRGAYQAILRRFAEGGADILVGTQLVAKGLDIHKVTLVGVLAADAAFNLPDYRSCERGFQLLTQVAGRAGRGLAPGKVILQTYSTELPALNLAQQHDYETFAAAELLSRKELEYPPYSQLIRIVISGSELIEVQAFCERLAEDLSKFLDNETGQANIKILGPAPCLLERIKESYRYHLLVKNMIGETGRKLITSFLQTRRVSSGLLMAVDIDAVDLL